MIKKPVRIAPRQDGGEQAPAAEAAPAQPACTDCVDLTIGPCEVQCFNSTTYSTELCARLGYRSDFAFRAMPTANLRNSGPGAVTFPAGTRLWSIEGEDPPNGRSPSTGLYLGAGAEVPAARRPVKTLLQPAPGDYTVRFVIDPDNLVAETDESNNVSECRWSVVAPTEPLQSDLALVSVTIAPAVGNHSTSFAHTVTIANVGNDDSGVLHVRCTPGSAWNEIRLGAGQTKVQTYPIPDIATMPPGTHTVTCTIAPIAAEPNTSNNAASATFTIEAD
jgi:hypothetical protein